MLNNSLIIEKDFMQGSPEWHQARIGNPGASEFSKIVSGSCKISGSRDNFIIEMAQEVLLGEKQNTYQTKEMAHGNKYEPDAREVIESIKNLSFDQCAMMYPDQDKRYHVSPDGYNEEHQILIEIKCPMLKAFMEYKEKIGKDYKWIPSQYRVQCQGQLMVSGYKYLFFVVYFPGLAPLIVTVDRNEKLISMLSDELNRFIEDMDKTINTLRG